MGKMQFIGGILAGGITAATGLIGYQQLLSDEKNRSVAVQGIKSEADLSAAIISLTNSLKGQSINLTNKSEFKQTVSNFGEVLADSTNDSEVSQLLILPYSNGLVRIPYEQTAFISTNTNIQIPINFNTIDGKRARFLINGTRSYLDEGQILNLNNYVNDIDCNMLGVKIDTKAKPPILDVKVTCK